ncbi:ribose-phosphate pyrophosphokinase [Oceanobacillus oncorhynchi subsp. incaldanensis]|uniref:ribose-phosphate diphosphokinase n=1 Tax=Oceanobacillus oncorhynchi TaxID=545501 RepID=UPI001B19E485|nr:ribose-phosphate diphosphokinase [Oceanobacillus oncorhynchi]GIO19564.1 ribose-phosphate pyrophosphokinase [Oceanobacillus oncorhynchi subsp. incaldanensis]
MKCSPKLRLFSLNSHYTLAKEIADILNVPLGKSSVKHFSDGEIQINIEESVRGCEVYLIQSTSEPANEHIMELLIMIDAMKRASAESINVVIPYYGYARQDRKARAREPITAKLIADLIETAGASRIITLDLHARQIQGFFDLPVDQLMGVPVLAEYFKKKLPTEEVIVVAPDNGGVGRARKMATILDAPIALIDKRRPKPNVSQVMNVIGDVAGKKVILIDDLIDTAGTLISAADALIDRGAEEIYACCTHPVLSGPAVERIESSIIKELVITNSIYLPEEKQINKITSLTIAPLLADAVLRVHNNASVSVLFE